MLPELWRHGATHGLMVGAVTGFIYGAPAFLFPAIVTTPYGAVAGGLFGAMSGVAAGLLLRVTRAIPRAGCTPPTRRFVASCEVGGIVASTGALLAVLPTRFELWGGLARNVGPGPMLPFALLWVPATVLALSCTLRPPRHMTLSTP